MTAVTGFTRYHTHVPEVRVYKPNFKLCCDRTTFSVANSAGYMRERLAQMRRCCDPAADILGGIIAIDGVEFVTLDQGVVTVQFCRNANIDEVDAQIRQVLKRHPGS